jgi:hypothetical protein
LVRSESISGSDAMSVLVLSPPLVEVEVVGEGADELGDTVSALRPPEHAARPITAVTTTAVQDANGERMAGRQITVSL